MGKKREIEAKRLQTGKRKRQEKYMAFSENKKKEKNKPFRVAMIGHKRVPSREGGVEVVVWELATRLRDQGFDVECYNRAGYRMKHSDYDRIPGKPGYYRDGVRILITPTV